MTNNKPIPQYDWDVLFFDCRTGCEALNDDDNQERRVTGRYLYYSFYNKNGDVLVTLNDNLKIRAYNNYKYLADLPITAKQSLLKYMQQRFVSAQEDPSLETTSREDIALQKLKEAGVC